MKTMKKIFCGMIASALLLSLAACNKPVATDSSLSEEIIESIVIGTADQQTDSTDITESGKTDKTIAQNTQKGATTDKVQKSSKTATNITTAAPDTNDSVRTSRTRRTTTVAGAATTKATSSKTTVAGSTYVTETMGDLVADGRIKLIGRQEVSSNAIVMEYNNAAITLYGELEGSVTLSVANTSSSLCRMHVIIDGDTANASTVDIYNNTRSFEVCSGLKKGTHTIEIIRGTCNDWKSLEIYNVTYKGTLKQPPATDLRMEFLGDSITCAMGAILADGTYNYGAKWQDGFYSYAGVTARNLNADASVLSISGMATAEVHAKFDDIKRDQNDGAWDFAANPQDIVVVNLGTNDALKNLSSAAVSTAVNGLLADIRAAYGKKTYIIWAYGMMIDSNLSIYKNLVEGYASKNNDNRMLFCDLSSAKDTNGWATHPSQKGQAAAAQLLTAFIRKNCSDVL